MKRAIFIAALTSVCTWAGAREALAFKGPYCTNTTPQGHDGGYGVTCTGGAGPKVSSSGGRGLTHPLIAPLFWGTYWQSPTGATRSQMLAATQALVNGAHFGALSQYGANGGIGPARMVPAAPMSFDAVPSSLAASDAIAQINKDVGRGWLPPPAANSDMLYLLFVPPGYGDFNASGTCDATCGAAYDGLPYNFAWVTAGDSAGLSHELAESIAGNAGISNCTYVAGPNKGQVANQVADVCNCYSENNLFSGTESYGYVGAYWSAADGACVIPEGWPSLWSWNDPQANYWTQIVSTPVRQVYTAGTNVVFTDKNNDVQYYDWSTRSVRQLGGPGAMFAFADGGATLVGLNTDATQIFERPVAAGASWTPIGLPYIQGTAVYSSKLYPMATDVNGYAAYYVNGAWKESNWNNPGPGVAFAGSGWNDGIVQLTWDHGSVLRGDPQVIDGGFLWVNWTTVGGAATEIFADVGSDLIAGTNLTTAEDVWTLSPATNGYWTHQGGAGNAFAVAGYGTGASLWGLTPARTSVQHSNDAVVNNPGWTQIGLNTGRVIGGGAGPHGAMLVAVGCAGGAGTCVVY